MRSLVQALIQQDVLKKKEEKLITDIHIVRCNEKMKVEIMAMFLQAKEQQRLPANHKNLGERHEKILPHRLQREPTLLTP